MAAEAGILAQVWAGGYSEEAPAAMPYGGRERLLHTNPISMGFPAGSEPTMMLDYATTVLSGVKVDNARRRGEALPPGAIVDKEGRPTTDPEPFYDGGGHVQFGGHKGYALSMAAEFMGRIFTGASSFADPARGGPILRNQGVSFVFMRQDLLASADDYRAAADEMERRTRAVLPAPGFDEVLVPGDPERRARVDRMANGIPVEDEIWEQVGSLPRRKP
jgi:LDH2 family malate/lactate/ureidoglycolate dehydrogenase